MDYETARRVRGRSVKELTIRNIQQHEGILSFAKEGFGIGSAKRAIGAKASASITGMLENIDPLNLLSMMKPGLLQTMLMGLMPFRSSKSKKYFMRKSEQRQNQKAHYTKIGAGRATRLKVGDSTADILAKMYNLMEKDHTESLKRWELESEHYQQRKEEDERRHRELLDAITKGIHVEPVKEKEKDTRTMKEKFEDKIEKIFGSILKPFKEVATFFEKVFKFVFESFKVVAESIWKVVKWAGELAGLIFESVGNIAIKVIEYIGPILRKAFSSITGLIEKVMKYIAKHEMAMILGGIGGGNSGMNFKGGAWNRAKGAMVGSATVAASSAAMSYFDEYLEAKNKNNKGNLKGSDRDPNKKAQEQMYNWLIGTGGGAAVGITAAAASAALGFAPISIGLLAVGAGEGIAVSDYLNMLQQVVIDPATSAKEKIDLFYYGPKAMAIMDKTGKQVTDRAVAPYVLDYQKDVLVPMMAKEGWIMGTKNYNLYTMRPSFYDADEWKNGKAVEADPLDLFEAFVRSDVRQKLGDTGIPSSLNDFEKNATKKVATAMAPTQKRFENSHMLMQESIMKNFKWLTESTEDYAGQTIIKQIITNPAPPPVNYDTDEELRVRSDDGTLRKIQYNYSIGM